MNKLVLDTARKAEVIVIVALPRSRLIIRPLKSIDNTIISNRIPCGISTNIIMIMIEIVIEIVVRKITIHSLELKGMCERAIITIFFVTDIHILLKQSIMCID